MDEEATPARSELQGTVTTTTIVPQGTEIGTTVGKDLRTQQAVSNAAALGWAMAELLGRCFMLKDVQPSELDWSGDKVMLLQEIYTPREKIRALMVHIRFLADALDVSSCLIDDESDPDNTRPYVEVLEEHVKLLIICDHLKSQHHYQRCCGSACFTYNVGRYPHFRKHCWQYLRESCI